MLGFGRLFSFLIFYTVGRSVSLKASAYTQDNTNVEKHRHEWLQLDNDQLNGRQWKSGLCNCREIFTLTRINEFFVWIVFR
jgi:hypothetical protein